MCTDSHYFARIININFEKFVTFRDVNSETELKTELKTEFKPN